MARSRQHIRTRAAGHKKHYHPLPKALACMVAACFAADAALANPVGPTVVNGQVTFNGSGSRLTITNTPGSIINWQGFSIGVGELTQFIQQSASSAVLNRVTGIDPSVILGALQSNGRVFLINPNGILFGAGSQINVAGLIASTLNLSNADFLAGKLNFTATPGAGSLVNQGAITTPTGGQVYLIAPDVQNSGVITSPQGEIILAAGHSVELVDAGTPNLRVEVAASDEQAINLGQIVADSGKIGIYAGLIKNSGTLQANGVVIGKNGEILLKAVNNTTLAAGSTITATGTHGGTVEVLGNTVNVEGGTKVDVSGQTGGGTILIGGDEHGANPDVQNAQFTTVASGANLIADATDNGDGGKVIVWSDDTTKFDGHISARGGANGGNGGFAEVSGKKNLYLTGHADLSAPQGKFGTLLLDPGTVTIIDGAEGDNANTFQDTYISSQLGSSDVQITTDDNDNEGTQDINFNSNVVINWSTGTTLEFDSGHDIHQAGNISASNPDSILILNAGNALTLTGNITSGTVELSSGTGSLMQTAGTITAQYLSLSSNTNDASLPDANAVGTLAAQVGTLNFNNTGPLTIGTVAATNGGVSDINHFTMYGVDANNGSVAISTTGLLTVDEEVEAQASGSGPASVTLSGNGILIDGFGAEGSVYAYGGYSSSGDAGAATITLNGGSGIITINDAIVEADGGDVGDGSSGNGGMATITLNGGVSLLNSAYVHADGGEGGESGGNGGIASITFNAGASGISISSNSEVEADGGEGSAGAGGAANVFLNSAGMVSLNNSGIYAYGGEGFAGKGGDATIGVLAAGSISDVAIEEDSINAIGGNASGGIGGGANLGLFSTTGSILIDGDDVEAESGSGDTEGVSTATLGAGGNITVQNNGLVEADNFVSLLAAGDVNITNATVQSSGGIAVVANNLNVTANDGNATLATESNGGDLTIDVQGDVNVTASGSGSVAFVGGYSGTDITLGGSNSEVRIAADSESDAAISAAAPGAIHLTFLSRTSGGYSVNGNEGAISEGALFDPGAGFYIFSPDTDEYTPAVLGDSLIVNYGSPSNNGLPDSVDQALSFIIGQINNNTDHNETNNEEESSDDDKKKKSCS